MKTICQRLFLSEDNRQLLWRQSSTALKTIVNCSQDNHPVLWRQFGSVHYREDNFHWSEDNLAVPYFLPVLHFCPFLVKTICQCSIYGEDNCTTATYFMKTIVVVLRRQFYLWRQLYNSPSFQASLQVMKKSNEISLCVFAFQIPLLPPLIVHISSLAGNIGNLSCSISFGKDQLPTRYNYSYPTKFNRDTSF